jgi:hypothetical protein
VGLRVRNLHGSYKWDVNFGTYKKLLIELCRFFFIIIVHVNRHHQIA